jgi:alpha-tubulin suppressor-like RCC1 family protein
VSAGTGVIVNNVTNPNLPTATLVTIPATAGITITTLTANTTYVLVSNVGTILQQTTIPTEQQLTQNIYLGYINTWNNTNVNSVVLQSNVQPSPALQQQNFVRSSFALINIGNSLVANGANLNLNATGGILNSLGINYNSNAFTPNELTIASATTVSFRMATRTTISPTPVIALPVTFYDVAGVVTSIPTGAGSATNFRVFLQTDGTYIIQYGQQTYSNLANAVAGATSETFINHPINNSVTGTGILLGVISTTRGSTLLNNTGTTTFQNASRFGDNALVIGGTTSYTGTNGISVAGTIITSTATTIPTANAIAQWDSNLNLSANNHITAIATTTTAGGATTLLATSAGIQRFIGVSNQAVFLPSATTLLNGTQYTIQNESTGTITVNNGAGTALSTVLPNQDIIYTLVSGGSTGGNWHVQPSLGKLSYINATKKITSTVSNGQNVDITFDTINEGNIPNDGTNFTLVGGVTYDIQTNIGLSTNGQGDSVVSFAVVNSSTLAVINNQYGLAIPPTFGRADINPSSISTSYTPATTMQVKVRITACWAGGTPVNINGNAVTQNLAGIGVVNLQPATTYLNIKVATGSSASSTSTALVPKFANGRIANAMGLIFIVGNQLYRNGAFAAGNLTPYGGSATDIAIPSVVPVLNTGAVITGWLDVMYTYDSAIALTTDGRVFTWGRTIGGTTGSAYATLVIFPGSPIIASIYGHSNISSGNSGSSFFAISSTGAVYSWGLNATGQLGLGNTTTFTTPQLITGLNGIVITKISMGGNNSPHVMALSSTGTVYTWGFNGAGQIGNNTLTTQLTPYLASGTFSLPATGAIDILATGQRSNNPLSNVCTSRVLFADGTTYACGTGVTGGLSTSSAVNSSVWALAVTSNTSGNIKAIFSGELLQCPVTAVVDSNGNLFFAGLNQDQCLGNGLSAGALTTIYSNTGFTTAGFQGKMLPTGNGITPKVVFMGSIDNGNSSFGFNTCYVLDNTGAVYSCGNNQFGQCGQGIPTTTTSISTWGRVIIGNNVANVTNILTVGFPNATTGTGLAIILSDGTMMCLGQNKSGSLGIETAPSNTAIPFAQYVIGFNPL